MVSISSVKKEIAPFMHDEFSYNYNEANDLCNETLSPFYASSDAAMAALHDLKTKLIPIIINMGKTNIDDSNVIRRIDVKTADLWEQASEEQEKLSIQNKKTTQEQVLLDPELEKLQETLYTTTNDPVADKARHLEATTRIWNIVVDNKLPSINTNTSPSSLFVRIFRCFKRNSYYIISTIRNKLAVWKKRILTKL